MVTPELNCTVAVVYTYLVGCAYLWKSLKLNGLCLISSASMCTLLYEAAATQRVNGGHGVCTEPPIQTIHSTHTQTVMCRVCICYRINTHLPGSVIYEREVKAVVIVIIESSI